MTVHHREAGGMIILQDVTTLIAADNHWALLAILFASAFLTVFLEQRYKWASKVSGAVIILVIAIVLVNLLFCFLGGKLCKFSLEEIVLASNADMGSPFDFFGEISHPDYRDITEEQYANRMLLRDVMTRHGFRPLESEWWHFTLENEPYPDTFFTFPVR